MDDLQIVELYFARSEQAIKETDSKYGKLCFKLAKNLLLSNEDAEECVNDTYLSLWNKIPPTRPNNFTAFICKIARNLSLKKLESASAKKRTATAIISLTELEEVLPDNRMEAKNKGKKTWAIILVAAAISLLLMGAGITVSNYIVDTCSDVENGYKLSGIELKYETVYLEVSPTSTDIQLTEDNILTNTTQITVSADSIKDDTKISLFLYNADNLDTPILYATITRKDKSVDFTNLTSRFAYKVGATVEGTDENVTLKITD